MQILRAFNPNFLGTGRRPTARSDRGATASATSSQAMQRRDYAAMRASHNEDACVFKVDLRFRPNWRKCAATQHEDFQPRTMWSLSNAFTSAFKELDPIPQFKATAKLGAFLEERLARKF